VTQATVFRVIESVRPTLIIDEADTFVPENDALKGVLNSGHSRPTAFILRSVGENFEPRKFSTWAPIVIAGIGKLPDTLTDRSVVIRMRRKNASERVLPLDEVARAALVEVGRKIVRWARDNREGLVRSKPVMPQAFDNRLADNWRPLLAIADVAGGEWPTIARTAALIFCADAAREDDDVKVSLLSDIRRVFEENERRQLFSETICEALAAFEGRPWGEWKQGKPITKNALARLLKSFDVSSGSIRIGSDTGKGYRVADFQEAFSRYLPPIQNVTTSQQLAEKGSGNSKTSHPELM
jgi:hypothetical protein